MFSLMNVQFSTILPKGAKYRVMSVLIVYNFIYNFVPIMQLTKWKAISTG